MLTSFDFVQDESDLLRLSSELNEISASAILSNHTAAQFVEMYPDEAIMTYSSVCGEERIVSLVVSSFLSLSLPAFERSLDIVASYPRVRQRRI